MASAAGIKHSIHLSKVMLWPSERNASRNIFITIWEQIPLEISSCAKTKWNHLKPSETAIKIQQNVTVQPDSLLIWASMRIRGHIESWTLPIDPVIWCNMMRPVCPNNINNAPMLCIVKPPTGTHCTATYPPNMLPADNVNIKKRSCFKNVVRRDKHHSKFWRQNKQCGFHWHDWNQNCCWRPPTRATTAANNRPQDPITHHVRFSTYNSEFVDGMTPDHLACDGGATMLSQHHWANYDKHVAEEQRHLQPRQEPGRKKLMLLVHACPHDPFAHQRLPKCATMPQHWQEENDCSQAHMNCCCDWQVWGESKLEKWKTIMVRTGNKYKSCLETDNHMQKCTCHSCCIFQSHFSVNIYVAWFVYFQRCQLHQLQSHPFNPTPAFATFIHQYNAPARCAAMCSLVLRLPPEKKLWFWVAPQIQGGRIT